MGIEGVSCHGKVLLVELSPSVPNLGRYIVMPRFGLLAIASILSEKTRYKIKLLFEPYVGTIDVERIVREEPKFILVNGLTTSAQDNESFVGAIRKRLGRSVPVIAGGEHATMFPFETLRYADYVLLYEGDETILELLAALEEPDPSRRDRLLEAIPGLLYRDLAGIWRLNREIRRLKKIDFRYDFRVVEGSEKAFSRFRLCQIPLQTSRGCTHYCSFCSWISLFGKVGYLLRPIDDVLWDILHTIEYTGFRSFIVTDNLFGGDVGYAEELLHRIAVSFEGRAEKPSFTVMCRADQFANGANMFSDRHLDLMRKAGVTHVSLGIESISGRSLVQMRKQTGISTVMAATERLHRHGFNIAATFVTGFDGDRYEDVLGIADFATKIGCFTIQVYARNITPHTLDSILAGYRVIPGCPDKYRNGHAVNTFPALMLPSVLQRGIFEAASRFYEGKDPQKRLVGRIYKQIWSGIATNHEALRKVENDVLLPEKIYMAGKDGGYLLQEKALQALMNDPERVDLLRMRVESAFRSVARKSHADSREEMPAYKEHFPGAVMPSTGESSSA